ncbi:MAG TPA: DJ-1 family glyoxalase III [Bacteroidaceae bacterium]|nr:DJ-1 family glyoxalase III [Bacteroidaceae bacterium]
MVYIFLADGFESIEAVVPLNMLRRANIDVTAVSITGNLSVKSSLNTFLIADQLFENVDFTNSKMIILPGGQPGATNLMNHEGLKRLITEFAEAGKPLAAICAAPVVLGKLGVLNGRRATVYPGYESLLKEAKVTGNFVEVDENIITAVGPAASFDFTGAIIKLLKGDEVLDKVRKDMRFVKS